MKKYWKKEYWLLEYVYKLMEHKREPRNITNIKINIAFNILYCIKSLGI